MDKGMTEDEVLKLQKSGRKKISDSHQDSENSEEGILRFWKKNKIYLKSKKKNSKGKKFYFMDGPPYATGHIHMGTALNKILKDIAMRTRRMQGYDVFDRPGYDTHGVPIELQIEKEIGSRSKKDIEKFGTKKFIQKCKEFVDKHIKSMNKDFKDLGLWMDWSNPYVTYYDEYIEAIWSAFKAADKKGLLYLGRYPVHVCSRCETAVAYNEIEYGKQKDTSVFVKFPLKKKKNIFFIIFTTTPWTLPANTGVMAHPEADYQEIEVGGERWIIAKELVPALMAKFGKEFTVKEEFKGKKIEGWEYENPLAKNLKLKVKNGYRVVLSGKYVTIQEGTGLVHCAPGHGKEDYEVGKENGLDMPCPVGADGILTEEAGKYKGKRAWEVDAEIINDLESGGFLAYKTLYEHDYPLCWRCKTPLLMVSIPQWFLKISKIHDKLLKENEEVNWIPGYMKARMGAWLEGIGDWPISRQRYWGTPLPIWHDPQSGERIVVGSISELKKLSGKKRASIHKPDIDRITIKGKSGKILRRVPEVLDVWFDSGVSSWAALGYPASKEKFKKYWPADLNIEGKDQFRGWWNSQMILSEIIFGKKPFSNVLVHGMILDISKNKMSKSKGNIVTPKEVIKKYGRDYIRYYFAKLSKGEDFAYDEREFGEIGNVFRVLTNISTFIDQTGKGTEKKSVEDRWIISRFNSALRQATESMNNYKFYDAISKIEEFLIRDFSRTYIQMIRERSDETYETLNEIRISLLKIFSPVIPFTTEAMWQELRERKIVKEESIFLSGWPEFDRKKINEKLEEEFNSAFEIIERGLAERDRLKIGLRWPLADATCNARKSVSKDVQEVIARQLNVKKLISKIIKEPANVKVVFNTKINAALEAEGFAREIARRVQAERKNMGLVKSDLISLKIFLDEKLRSILKSQLEYLKEKTGSRDIKIVDKSQIRIVFTIKEREIGVGF